MNNFNESSEKTGWLLKWTNYLKGYQRRYFVLADGILSYYKYVYLALLSILCLLILSFLNKKTRNESEVNVNCRGRIALASAVIKPLQNCNFLINKGGHESFHLKADNEKERAIWLMALNSANKVANKNEDDYADSSTDSKSFDDDLKEDLDNLFLKLQDIKACQEKLNKSGILLQKLLTDLDILDRQDLEEQLDKQATIDNPLRSKLINDILKQFKEKNGSYKIALNSTLNSSSQFSLLAQQYFPKWCKKLKKEHETNRNYEQVINQLANHIKNFEEQIKENNQLPYANDDDEKFYDAEEFANSSDNQHFSLSTVPGKAHRITGDLSSNNNNNNYNAKRNSIQKNANNSIHNNKESTTDESASIGNNLFNNNNDEEEQFANNNNEELSNESRDDDELSSLGSCNEDDRKLDHQNFQLDEMIKSSVVLTQLNDIEQKLTDSFSRNSSSNNITTKYLNEQNSSNQDSSETSSVNSNRKRVRRTRIPERPNHPLNLWSILKNSIGRDLSKIPMPVNFNEPLSMLQRVTEG